MSDRKTISVLSRIPFFSNAAVIAAMGGILSEVGAVNMVGGNIAGETRVLTTAIMMHTSMGEYEVALSQAAVLGLPVPLAFVIPATQIAGLDVAQTAIGKALAELDLNDRPAMMMLGDNLLRCVITFEFLGLKATDDRRRAALERNKNAYSTAALHLYKLLKVRDEEALAHRHPIPGHRVDHVLRE